MQKITKTTTIFIILCMILSIMPKSIVFPNGISIELFTSAAAAGETIQNGDGISYSGTITSNPIGPGMKMTMYGGWPSGAAVGQRAGAIFDGQYIWFPPTSSTTSNGVVKLNKDTGEMTSYNSWPSGFISSGTTPFAGGASDGENIWMIPYGANQVMKINKNTGNMTAYSGWPSGINVTNSGKFLGGTFDGQNIWMIPNSAGKIVKVDKDTGNMTAYSGWSSGTTTLPFGGAVFDGQKIWGIPYNADKFISIDKDTGVMTDYNSWPSGFVKSSNSFKSGIFDGQKIWAIPSSADRVISIDKDTGTMTGYKNWPSGFVKGGGAFWGGAFDGQNIWMVPQSADRVIKIDKDTGVMTGYKNWPSGFVKNTFIGGVFDGNNVWMSPNGSTKVIKLSANNLPTISNSTKTGSKNITMTFAATDFTGVYADLENDPLTTIKITALPDASNGTLKLNGTNIQLNAEIPAANIPNITFVPVTDWYGDATFSWKANDYNDYSATAATMTLHMENLATQIAQVTNVTLSNSGIASWDNAANESSFEVQLYKDGAPEGSSVSEAADTLSHDFLAAMKSAGPGVYTVKVTAKGDGGVNYTDSTQSSESNGQTIIQLGTVSTGITWTGDIAHWDGILNAVSYDVELYKDGVVQGSSVNILSANSASGVDFASAISSAGIGTYTYKVTAKGNDPLTLDGLQSGLSSNNVKTAPIVITITAGKGLGRADKKAEYTNAKIPFSIDSESFSKGLTGYSFDVIYDPSKVGTVTVDNFNALAKPTVGVPTVVGSQEKVTVTWNGTFTGDLTTLYNGSKGVLFKLNFVVKSAFTSGETPIEISNSSFTFSSRASSTSITANSGKIMFGIYGDVNGDGLISSLDTGLINKYISGRTTAISEDVKQTAADVNEDGSITSVDAIEILNYILEKASTLKNLFGY